MKQNMIWPCCKTELPAPLEGVAKATCPCGQSYIPEVIVQYNRMLAVINGWEAMIAEREK